jgi:ribosomal RNA-processing protein 9
VGEKKMRMAKEWLQKVTEVAKRGQEDDDEDEDESGGRRVAEILQRKQLEESGRKRREIAARSQTISPRVIYRMVVCQLYLFMWEFSVFTRFTSIDSFGVFM